MRAFRIAAALVVLAVGIVSAPLAAAPPGVPEVADWSKTNNMTAIGFAPPQLPDSGAGSANFNTDLAFWGDLVYQARSRASASSTSRSRHGPRRSAASTSA